MFMVITPWFPSINLKKQTNKTKALNTLKFSNKFNRDTTGNPETIFQGYLCKQNQSADPSSFKSFQTGLGPMSGSC